MPQTAPLTKPSEYPIGDPAAMPGWRRHRIAWNAQELARRGRSRLSRAASLYAHDQMRLYQEGVLTGAEADVTGDGWAVLPEEERRRFLLMADAEAGKAA